MRTVKFHQLASWVSSRGTGYEREVDVWIAFDERLVATGEADGPSWHAAICSPEEMLQTWPGRFEDPESQWLLPIVQQLATGQDVAARALAEYRQRHEGDDAPTQPWSVPR